MDWITEAQRDNENQGNILSFQDFMQHLEARPQWELRPSYRYLLDMMDYFGKDDKGGFKLFLLDFADCPPVFGQVGTQHAIYQNLINFQDEGYNNKFILLVGPNGSAKSSLINKLMRAAEEYSNLDEGKLYSFSWIFPIDNYVKTSLGLNQDHGRPNNLKSFAQLGDKDISAILTSELQDHPVLLIPMKHRQKIIDDLLRDHPEHLRTVKKSYLYTGDLSKRNKMIYDALLKSYKGDHAEVLKHIRVERYHISKRYSHGAVTIEPQMHVDARLQQITMDKRLGSLPPSLQSLNLFSLQGEVVLANRGILEYSDLLKRPLDAFKYLLTTVETKSISLGGITTELDILFVGTSNEIHMQAFKQHPDFNSFKGRFNFVKVPYLLNYLEEEKIYMEQIKGLSGRTHFEPHSLTVLCLFSVMTRLRAPTSVHYKDEKLGKIIATFSPLEKAFLLADKDNLPSRLDVESKQIIRQNFDEIKNEYDIDLNYEGKFGISPREVKKIIYKLSNRNEVVSFVEIFEHLENLILKKNDHDFLNMASQGDYHHYQKFIESLRKYALGVFDQELRDSLGMIDNRSYEEHIRRYIEQINARIKGEKIKNNITGKYESDDEYFIKEFEISIGLKEEPIKFRSHLISTLGAYYLDNPNRPIVYTEVFKDLSEKLKQSFREDQKKVIESVAKNMVFFEAELKNVELVSSEQLTEKNREQIQNILNRLQNQYGYSQKGAMGLIKYALDKLY